MIFDIFSIVVISIVDSNFVILFVYLFDNYVLFTDSTQYAHYVFKAFDINCNGAISFKVITNFVNYLPIYNYR